MNNNINNTLDDFLSTKKVVKKSETEREECDMLTGECYTIREKDGTEHVVPAYGKDMQDAIERLIWNERYSAVSNKKATTPIIVFLLLSTIILSGILAYEHDNPLWILGAMLINLIFGLIAKFADNYLRK